MLLSRACVCALFVFTSLTSLAVPVTVSSAPEKGQNDPASYQYMTLENGVKVLLVSDNAMALSYASLSVKTGYFDDPEAIPGLAHLYEHMLSKGSKAYPDPAEYKQFLADNGGRSNASTSAWVTNYYMQVSSDKFDEGVARFAAQFIAPTIPKSLVYGERHAVDAEFRMKYSEDSRRKREVLRTLVSRQHPFHKFSVGNLNTLVDQDFISLHQALVNFSQQHYCAERMSAVLAGPQNLTQLSAMAAKEFTAIPKGCSATETYYVEPFDMPLANKALVINTLSKSAHMSMTFVVPNNKQIERGRLNDFIGWAFESYNPSGLEHQLKQQKLIADLSVYEQAIDPTHSLLHINFNLTKSGKKNMDEIARAAQDYLQLFIEHADQALYEQFAQLQRQRFELEYRHKNAEDIRKLATTLLDTSANEVLTFATKPAFPGQDVMNSWLAAFNHHNMLTILEDDSYAPSQVEPLYNTAYEVRKVKLAASTIDKLEFTLPAESKYQADTSGEAAVPGKSKRADFTVIAPLIEQDPYTSIRIYVNHKMASDRDIILNQRLEIRADKALSAITDEAKGNGISVSVGTTSTGLLVTMQGRQGNWPALMEDLLVGLADMPNWDVSASKEKEKLEREFSVYPTLRARDLSYRYLKEMFGMRLSEKNYQSFIDGFKERKFTRFINEYWGESSVDVIAYGPLSSKDTDAISALLARLDTSDKSEKVSAAAKLWDGTFTGGLSHVKYSGSDKIVNLVLLPAAKGSAVEANTQLLAAFLTAPFFHQLRTQDQLGYSVKVYAQDQSGFPYLNFFVQSPQTPVDTLLARIERFNQWAIEQIAGLSADDFELLKLGVSQSRQQRRLNSDVLSADLAESQRLGLPLDYQNQVINQIQNTKLTEFKAWASRLLQQPLQGVMLQGS